MTATSQERDHNGRTNNPTFHFSSIIVYLRSKDAGRVGRSKECDEKSKCSHIAGVLLYPRSNGIQKRASSPRLYLNRICSIVRTACVSDSLLRQCLHDSDDEVCAPRLAREYWCVPCHPYLERATVDDRDAPCLNCTCTLGR